VKLAVVHARLETLELGRYPSFVVPTLLFPALFFLLFVVPGVSAANADAMMASYVAFAFLGVAFFQFGVGIAAERASSWALYLRTLPAQAFVHLAGRVMSALAFSIASGAAVVVTASALTPARLEPPEWLFLVVALVVGVIPFALLGIAIGYLVRPKGALPVANVLYLGLAYAGGLWTGPGRMPDAVTTVSPGLPTRQWADVVTASADGLPPPLDASLGLIGWTAAFGMAAVWAFRRDEGASYR
jgi:ABC-2 type transport system permease protein